MLSHIVIAATALVVSGLTLFSGFGLGTILMPVFALLARLDAGEAGARFSGALPQNEIAEVNRLYKRLAARRGGERPTDLHRDDPLLAQLDHPRFLDALLTLPARIVERVLTVGLAYDASGCAPGAGLPAAA